MKVNEKYLKTMYIAFGQGARDKIRTCVEAIIATLEKMPEDEKNAILCILDPEVKKAIIDD